MGAVDFFKGLVGVFSFSSPTHAGKGEASAFNSPTKSVKVKRKSKALNYPDHCEGLLKYLRQSKKRVYLEEIMQELGKEKSTVYYEMCKLRKGGVKIKKTYIRSTGKFKYYPDSAA